MRLRIVEAGEDRVINGERRGTRLSLHRATAMTFSGSGQHAVSARLGERAPRHRVVAVQDELEEPPPRRVLFLDRVRLHLAVTLERQRGQVVHVREDGVLRECRHDRGGQLGGPADLHGVVGPGDLAPTRQAACRESRLRPSSASCCPSIRATPSWLAREVAGSATRSTNDVRACSTPVRMIWPYGPSMGRGVLRDLVPDRGDDLVGETRTLGTEDGGQSLRQHVGLLVPRAVLAAPRHCRWLRPRRVAATRATGTCSTVNPAWRSRSLDFVHSGNETDMMALRITTDAWRRVSKPRGRADPAAARVARSLRDKKRVRPVPSMLRKMNRDSVPRFARVPVAGSSYAGVASISTRECEPLK